jgi:hypothetical protein
VKLYFAGTEIPAWRELLSRENVQDVSMSFFGLTRRVLNTDAWSVAAHFPDFQNIFLDSGAFSVNKKDSTLTTTELEAFSSRYQEFITGNLDRIEMVSEFDALDLGQAFINEQRSVFYDDLGDKFAPVWHFGLGGVEELERLCAGYSRVIIVETDFGHQNMATVLNNFTGRYGTRIHGALTHTNLMREIHWDSVASTSWMSSRHYHDTTVWTGTELKRYPLKYKDQSRKRHRSLFEANGFDPEKIINDEGDEVLRLAIWSWQKFVEDINSRVTPLEKTPVPENAEVTPGSVDHQLGVLRNGEISIKRKTEPLPLFFVQENQQGDDVFAPRSDSMRMCNTCFLKSNCPGFLADSNCLYDIDIRVRTPEQLRGIMDGLIEMQTQRVIFGQMAEQLGGGSFDPNFSGEIDRLTKLVTARQKLEEKGAFISIRAQGPAGSNVMEQFFGPQAAERLSAIEHPVSRDADEVIAEILEETGE